MVRYVEHTFSNDTNQKCKTTLKTIFISHNNNPAQHWSCAQICVALLPFRYRVIPLCELRLTGGIFNSYLLTIIINISSQISSRLSDCMYL